MSQQENAQKLEAASTLASIGTQAQPDAVSSASTVDASEPASPASPGGMITPDLSGEDRPTPAQPASTQRPRKAKTVKARPKKSPLQNPTRQAQRATPKVVPTSEAPRGGAKWAYKDRLILWYHRELTPKLSHKVIGAKLGRTHQSCRLKLMWLRGRLVGKPSEENAFLAGYRPNMIPEVTLRALQPSYALQGNHVGSNASQLVTAPEMPQPAPIQPQAPGYSGPYDDLAAANTYDAHHNHSASATPAPQQEIVPPFQLPTVYERMHIGRFLNAAPDFHGRRDHEQGNAERGNERSE